MDRNGNNRHVQVDSHKLEQRMRRRPSVDDLMNRGVLWAKPEQDITHEMSAKDLRRRRMSRKLDEKLSQRPQLRDLILKGILKDYHDQFRSQVQQDKKAVEHMHIGNHEKRDISNMFDDLLHLHSENVNELNEEVVGMKNDLDGINKDSENRERALNRALDDKEIGIRHLESRIKEMEHEKKEMEMEYEDKLAELQEKHEEEFEREKKYHEQHLKTHADINKTVDMSRQNFDTYLQQIINVQKQVRDSLPQEYQQSSNNMINYLNQLTVLHRQEMSQQKESIQSEYNQQVLNNRQIQDDQIRMIVERFEKSKKESEKDINKLKSDKKAMMQVVNKKMQELKYMHAKELEKERRIASVLSTNLQEAQLVFAKDVENLRAQLAMAQNQQQYQQMNNNNNNNQNGNMNNRNMNRNNNRNNRNNNNNNNNMMNDMDEKDNEIEALRNQLQFLQTQNKEVLMQNVALKNSKKNLEKQVISLSRTLTRTLKG